MLNMISSNETAETAAAIFAAAVKPRPRYGLGASARIEVTTPATARVAVATRPCTDAAVPAAHGSLAGFGLGVTQQLIGEQSEFMTLTRTSASGGGAVGPHTAREPV